MSTEIYDCAIELYGYGMARLSTFHERTESALPPIRLSFRGGSHYNSLRTVCF